MSSKQGVRKQQICKDPRPARMNQPLPHQQRVIEYFLNESPHKGLLLYHKLGSGKTCTAIFVADEMLKRKDVDHIFILSPGSLRENWIKEYCKKCGKNYLSDKYTFITYNYQSKISDLNFWNSLVIIDEVHNVINASKNESDLVDELLTKMKHSNCRVLALSGTPFYNYIYEWSLLGNMLKPNTFEFTFQGDPLEYEKRWEQQEVKITDVMLRGIVSFIPGDKTGFPRVIHEEPIRVALPDHYSLVYLDRFEQERKIRIIGPPDPDLRTVEPDEYRRKQQKWIMAIQRMDTRRLSNLYPQGLDVKMVQDPPLPSGAMPAPYETFLPDLPASAGPRTSKVGWMRPEILRTPGLNELSPKFAALLRNLTDWRHLGRKHVIFSTFLTRGGIYFLKTILDWCGIPALMYTGDQTDSVRTRNLEAFNDPTNAYGTKWKVLLVTEAGVEGISLFDVGHLHLVESHTVGGQLLQAIGRVARYGSHARLPEAEREVHIWRYFAIPYGKDTEQSVDLKLYQRAEENQEKLETFLERLQANSIENTDDYDVQHPYAPPLPPAEVEDVEDVEDA